MSEWQENLVQSILEIYERGDRVILNMPRRSGRALTADQIRRLAEVYDFVVKVPE